MHNTTVQESPPNLPLVLPMAVPGSSKAGAFYSAIPLPSAAATSTCRQLSVRRRRWFLVSVSTRGERARSSCHDSHSFERSEIESKRFPGDARSHLWITKGGKKGEQPGRVRHQRANPKHKERLPDKLIRKGEATMRRRLYTAAPDCRTQRNITQAMDSASPWLPIMSVCGEARRSPTSTTWCFSLERLVNPTSRADDERTSPRLRHPVSRLAHTASYIEIFVSIFTLTCSDTRILPLSGADVAAASFTPATRDDERLGEPVRALFD